MRSFVRFLYRFARVMRDIEVLLSGSPKKMARRFGNKAIGRHITRRFWLK